MLMAFGLIGTGLLAVPILTGLGGLCRVRDLRLEMQPRRQAGQGEGVLPDRRGLDAGRPVLMHFVGINEMQALFWTAVINGFLAPPLLVIILLISNNRPIMGHRVNGLAMNVMGWLTAAPHVRRRRRPRLDVGQRMSPK